MIRKIIYRLKRVTKSYLRNLFKIDRIKINDVEINLSHKSISPLLKKFFYDESYEGDEVEILSRHLDKNDIVMEIGAGIGFLSTFCSKRIGSERVYAYEANPYMIEKIEETYDINKVNPTIKNILLSNKEGKVSFYLEENFWSSSTIQRSKSSECIKVMTKNINEEISFVNPTFLIIDIEGGEKDLIPLIDFCNHNIIKVIIEIHPKIIGSMESSKVISHIISNGFVINFESSRNLVYLFERLTKDIC